MGKNYFLILFFFSSIGLFSQDPGHCLFLRMIENGKLIKGKELKEYKAELLRERMRFDGKHVLSYATDTIGFFYFDWGAFGNEIHEIILMHKKENMTVRFKMNPDSLYRKNEHPYTEQLYLDIPFKSGYYEVTDFVRERKRKTAEYDMANFFIKSNYQWIDLPEEKRQLMLKKSK